MKEKSKRIIVGISGASGIIYGVRLLEELKKADIESHLVVTKAGHLTRAYETDLSKDELLNKAHKSYRITDIAAPIASGSFQTAGMIIAPCSMNSLAEIAQGLGSNLLSRAADVILKERRRLVVVPREAPLTLAHLNNMTKITEMGGIIFPPNPAFYQKPESIDDIVNDTIGRILDLFAIETNLVKRWEG